MDNDLLEAYVENLKRLLVRIVVVLERLSEPAPSSGAEAPESSPPMWCQETDHNLLVDIRHLLYNMMASRQPSDSAPLPRTTERDMRADRWGAVTESTNQTTPPSSPSAPPGTPTFHVGPGCGCASDEKQARTLLQIRERGWNKRQVVTCSQCGALWVYELIPAPDAAPSTTGSENEST
jgi:hypothetical protein